MKKQILVILLALHLTGYSSFVYAGVIEVHTEIELNSGEREIDTLEHIIIIKNKSTTDHKVSIEFNERDGEYEKFVKMILKDVPDGFYSTNFDALIPFYEESHKKEFLLYAHNYEPGNNKYVRELHRINISKLKGNELFRYYAKAHIQADYVLNNINPMDRISRDNVRAVYHYLQSVRQLAWEYHIEPDYFSSKAYQWFQSAFNSNLITVRNAVGESDAKLILEQYRKLPTEKYSRLWRNALDYRRHDFDSYCSILHNLQDALLKLDADELKIINDEKKLMPLVSTALAQCLWRGIIGYNHLTIFDKYDKKELINNQILLLEKNVDIAKPWSKLVSDVKSHMHDLEIALKDYKVTEIMEKTANQ